MVICRCDGTVDGILTAVFDAWSIDINSTEISVCNNDNMVIFAEYRDVETNQEKASRVSRAVKEKISPEAYEMVCYACLSSDPERGNAVLQFIRKGFRVGPGIINKLQDDAVMKIFSMRRNCTREIQHYMGFVRFRQQGEYLFAKFEPHNNILVPIAEFFADRLMQENFVIADMKRNMAAVHAAGGECFVCKVDAGVIASLKYDDDEETVRKLWDTFQRSISISARRNEKLQRQNMPLRFRKYMDIRK